MEPRDEVASNSTLVTSELCPHSFLLLLGWGTAATLDPDADPQQFHLLRKSNKLKGSWSATRPGLLSFGMFVPERNKTSSCLSLCFMRVLLQQSDPIS